MITVGDRIELRPTLAAASGGWGSAGIQPRWREAQAAEQMLTTGS